MTRPLSELPPTREQALDLLGELEAIRTLNAPEGYLLATGCARLRLLIESAAGGEPQPVGWLTPDDIFILPPTYARLSKVAREGLRPLVVATPLAPSPAQATLTDERAIVRDLAALKRGEVDLGAFDQGIEKLQKRARAAIQAALPRGEEPTTVGRALDNCRMYAAKHRKEEWAKNILRLCADGGSVPSPLRANSPLAVGPYPHCHGEGCTEEGDPEIGSAKMECDLCDGTGAAPTVKWEYRQRNPQTGETLGPWFSCSAKGAERAKACGYEVRATPPAAAGAAIQGMADEYQGWIDFYHSGRGNYEDFLRMVLAASPTAASGD